jgi:NADH dehydrogenase (ubiquinone) flavoprotein 1
VEKKKLSTNKPNWLLLPTMLKASSSSSSAVLRTTAGSLRTFATVADPPVRRYGGLKDQDRIFTNAYCRHDFGLKGAKVSFPLPISV